MKDNHELHHQLLVSQLSERSSNSQVSIQATAAPWCLYKVGGKANQSKVDKEALFVLTSTVMAEAGTAVYWGM